VSEKALHQNMTRFIAEHSIMSAVTFVLVAVYCMYFPTSEAMKSDSTDDIFIHGLLGSPHRVIHPFNLLSTDGVKLYACRSPKESFTQCFIYDSDCISGSKSVKTSEAVSCVAGWSHYNVCVCHSPIVQCIVHRLVLQGVLVLSSRL